MDLTKTINQLQGVLSDVIQAKSNNPVDVQSLQTISTLCESIIKIAGVTSPINSFDTAQIENTVSATKYIMPYVKQEKQLTTGKIYSDRECMDYFNDFKNTIDKAVSDPRLPEVVLQCVNVIYKWFNVRCINNSHNTSNSHYNINNVPIYITAIIIVYGYNYEIGNLVKYLAVFDNWVNDVTNNQKYYLGDYSVYEVAKGNYHKYANATAIYIYDILMETAFEPLVALFDDDIYFKKSKLREIYKSYPQIIEKADDMMNTYKKARYVS